MRTTNPPSVFISYNHEQKDFADKIELRLESTATVVRDNNVPNWSSLIEFMKTIRLQDFAILLISDEYLKSINCMFEVSQLLKDNNWVDKVMFAVFNNVKIYDTLEHERYISFWQQKRKDIENKIDSLPKQSVDGLVAELRKIDEIQIVISTFLNVVKDQKNPQLDDVIIAIEKRIIRYTVDDVCKKDFDFDGFPYVSRVGDKCNSTIKPPYPQENVCEDILEQYYSFFDMYNIKEASDIPIVSNWAKNSGCSTLLEIPIGKDENNSEMILRIGSNGDGNNGLILGVSGTGKSELLRTLILSAAVKYHPQKLAFHFVSFSYYDYECKDISVLPNVKKYYQRNEYGTFLVDLENEINFRAGLFHTHQVADMESYLKKADNNQIPYQIIIIDKASAIINQNEESFRRTLSYLTTARSFGIRFLFVSESSEVVRYISPHINYSILFNYDRFDALLNYDRFDFARTSDMSPTSRDRPGVALFISTRSKTHKRFKAALSGSSKGSEFSQVSELIAKEYSS